MPTRAKQVETTMKNKNVSTLQAERLNSGNPEQRVCNSLDCMEKQHAEVSRTEMTDHRRYYKSINNNALPFR